MQPALAVIGMRKAAGTGVDGGDALIVGGVGVTDAGHHTLGVQSSRISSGTVALGRHGALNDATARSLLPLIEDLLGGIDKISGVLRAHVLHGKEGALQIDALNASTAEVGAATLVRLGDGGAGILDLLDAIGERRGQPAGGPATGELGRADINALGIVIGSRVVIEAMDVSIDHTRCDPRSRVVLNLARGLVGLPGAKNAILDHKIAAQLRACRQEELVSLNCVRAHMHSLLLKQLTVVMLIPGPCKNKKRPPAVMSGRAPLQGDAIKR